MRAFIKILFFLSLMMAVLSRYVLFNIKHEVVTLENAIKDTSCRMAHIQEEMAVLSSEWSYLTNPSRIHHLVQRYLPKVQILKKNQLFILPSGK